MIFVNAVPAESEVTKDENQNDPIPEDTDSETETSGETETTLEETESESSGQEDAETGEIPDTGKGDATDASTVESPSGGSDLHDTPGVSGNGGELEEETFYPASPQISEEFQATVTEQLQSIQVQIICGNFILVVIAGIMIGKLILGRLK